MNDINKPKNGIKVISWCFYVNPNNLERLTEYLVGLKANKIAASWWFSDWTCRLYYDPLNFEKYPEVAEYITEICSTGLPVIELIPCREKYPLITERYRPFFEEGITATIVRDIDSILSYKDSCLVHEWLTCSHSKLLRYVEYQMRLFAMGGGIAIRGSFNPRLDFTQAVISKKFVYRGMDEERLSVFLIKAIHLKLITSVDTFYTRMTENGTYYIFDDFSAIEEKRVRPLTSEVILWPVPLYESQGGFVSNLEDGKYEKAERDISASIEFSKERHIQGELLMFHRPQIKEALNVWNEEWVR
jgi:hypothetical protein